MKEIRTRFAPSPTGSLHIGSLRTVIFNYLITKSIGGKMLLRIEDTDQKRKVEGSIEKLIEILNWVGIKFDEGPSLIHGFSDDKDVGKYGPYIQTQRLDIYKKYIDELIKKGEAYYCFCTPERLQKMREEQQAKKMPPRYDRKCRDLSEDEIKEKIKAGEKFVIRQKMPLDGEVVVHDELRGDITFKSTDLDDHVLIKVNKIPTYQFANVIDDYLMKISHVVRGSEWIPSFPKNILLYKAFGWTPPKFIHMALTLDKNGGKLSKRHGDVAVEDYKEKGYLPEALLNFSALMGWHPKGDKEIFSTEEASREFKIKDMGISPSIFDIDKLDYLNGYYIRQKNIDELVELCWPYLKENLKKTKNNNQKSKEFVKKVVSLEQERMKRLSEIGELTEFFFVDELNYEIDLLIWKKTTKEEIKNNLKQTLEQLEKISDKNWTKDKIEETMISYIKASEEKVGNFLWPMRVALTGKKASPGPFEVAEVLKKEESLERIKKAIGLL